MDYSTFYCFFVRMEFIHLYILDVKYNIYFKMYKNLATQPKENYILKGFLTYLFNSPSLILPLMPYLPLQLRKHPSNHFSSKYKRQSLQARNLTNLSRRNLHHPIHKYVCSLFFTQLFMPAPRNNYKFIRVFSRKDKEKQT